MKKKDALEKLKDVMVNPGKYTRQEIFDICAWLGIEAENIANKYQKPIEKSTSTYIERTEALIKKLGLRE
jgi:hypothetical protein